MKVYTGREEIYASEGNIEEIISKAFDKHLRNSKDIDYLYKYYKGNQPILQKVKTIRPEINNKVVVNHAYEFVNFYVGYVFSEVIQYVSSGECLQDEHKSDDTVARLNQMMRNEDKTSYDRELAQWILISGLGYRMCLPKEYDDETPFEVGVLDPRYTFVIRSKEFKNKPLYGVTYIVDEDKQAIKGTIYSEEATYTFTADSLGQSVRVSEPKKNVLGLIPIIEYRLNPELMGIFEIVISALDCLNNITSNRIDGIEQFVQSLLVLKGCNLEDEDIANINKLGAIVFGDAEGDAKMLTSQLDQYQTQSFVDDLYQTVLQIVGVPDRQASAGGNTGTALEIGQGWVVAESRAKSIETLWNKSEKEFLRVVRKILADSPSELDICLSDIDIKFTRNKTSNLLTKTQGLLNQLNAGIHPRIAIENIGLYSDPENVYIESREYLKQKGFKEFEEPEGPVIEQPMVEQTVIEEPTEVIKDTTM